jgi:HAD superfamily hydrolase (TIGR01509 family)
MTNPHNYKNIIFDLGGVILNLDFTRTEKAFAELGLTDFDSIYSKSKQQAVFDVFEKGEMSASQFRNEMRKYLNENISDKQIDTAWNAMLLDLPKARLNLLAKLKKDHSLFLLSNTNEIHYNSFTSYFAKEHQMKDLSHIFIKEYFSHQIGKRKPDAEIFEYVLNENALDPTQTLFIDDSIQHIEGAKKCGVNGLWLEKGGTILELFSTT